MLCWPAILMGSPQAAMRFWRCLPVLLLPTGWLGGGGEKAMPRTQWTRGLCSEELQLGRGESEQALFLMVQLTYSRSQIASFGLLEPTISASNFGCVSNRCNRIAL